MSEISRLIDEYRKRKAREALQQTEDDEVQLSFVRKFESLLAGIVEPELRECIDTLEYPVSGDFWRVDDTNAPSVSAIVRLANHDSDDESTITYSCVGANFALVEKCVNGPGSRSKKSSDELDFDSLSRRTVREEFVNFLRAFLAAS